MYMVIYNWMQKYLVDIYCNTPRASWAALSFENNTTYDYSQASGAVQHSYIQVSMDLNINIQYNTRCKKYPMST